MSDAICYNKAKNVEEDICTNSILSKKQSNWQIRETLSFSTSWHYITLREQKIIVKQKMDRELHDMVYPSYRVDSKSYISQEPDFIIHARKILIKHGQKIIIVLKFMI